MVKRDQYQLVPEDDPDFARFWAAYPKRVAKKEARRAWAVLKPSHAQVDQMIGALEWQGRTWSGWEFIPYPASWLRAERWTDERPRPTNGSAPWVCPHVDRCSNRQQCAQATILGRPVKDTVES